MKNVIPIRQGGATFTTTNLSQNESLISRVKNRAIKWLAGDKSVVMNVVIEGRVFTSGNSILMRKVRAHRCSCTFEYCVYVGAEPNPLDMGDFDLQSKMLRRIK